MLMIMCRIIGSILICASQNIGMLVVGRIINGIAVGLESAQVPVYISELSPPSKRGRFVGLQQWAITWGILIMYYISYGCSFIGNDKPGDYSVAAWRVPWGLQMIPAVGLGIAMFFLPESPRWLARKDRWEECHSVLAIVHAKGDLDHPFVQLEMVDIREMVEFERQNSDATFMDLFAPKMFYRTFTAIFCQIWSQLTGMNVMMYYINYVFDMAGYKGNATLLASSIQYIINVAMTLPALIWVDKWGRRPTMIVGALLMTIFMFTNAGLMGGNGKIVPMAERKVGAESMSMSGAPAKGLIACTYLFVASYAPTWGPCSWIYPPELFPLRHRGKGVAVATSANWAFNMALGLFTPVAFEQITYKTYIIFGVFNFAIFLHTFFGFPETGGKTLEDTEAIFEDPHGIRFIGTPAWKTSKTTERVIEMEQGNVDLEKVVGDRAVSTTGVDKAEPAAVAAVEHKEVS